MGGWERDYAGPDPFLPVLRNPCAIPELVWSRETSVADDIAFLLRKIRRSSETTGNGYDNVDNSSEVLRTEMLLRMNTYM